MRSCKKYLFLRERMRPYIKEQMTAAHEKGTPGYASPVL